MIKGCEYSVNPESSVEIDEKVGLFWKTSLHNFLEIRASEPIKTNAQNKENKTEGDTSEENKSEEIDSEDKDITAETESVELEEEPEVEVEPIVEIIKKTNKKK